MLRSKGNLISFSGVVFLLLLIFYSMNFKQNIPKVFQRHILAPNSEHKVNMFSRHKNKTDAEILQINNVSQHYSSQISPQPEVIKKNYCNKNKTDAVILLTMMRSGSSIVGSVFNQRSDVTYFYEPLFPFGERPCDAQAEERIEVLKHISRCELDKIQPLYKKAFERTNRNDINARCKIHNMCFTSITGKVSHFLSRDAGMCHIIERQQVCPEPIDMTELSKYCSKSLLVAMKVIYLCKLELLVPLLEDEDYNIKVIHLVRDPRSTVKSRTAPGLRMENIRYNADLVCEQLTPNVDFANRELKKSKWRNKYLQIRYEDFAMNPIKKTQQIYDFVGINMNENIKSWLNEATSGKNADDLSSRQIQGLKRNPATVLTAWRKELSFEKVVEIQKRCPTVFDELGYQVYNNASELKNVSKSHFIPEN